jgi:hypothetical protein
MRFAADISIWWLIPWFAFALLAGLWFYKKVNWVDQLSKPLQWLLRGLRTISVFLLGLLLVGLILESVRYRDEKPVLITMIDNSSSMLNYKDSTRISRQVDAWRKALKDRFSSDFDLIELSVGADARYADSFDFKDLKTNLSQGFERVYEDYYNRNVGGIVLISDGNFNDGPNPVYAAEKISLTPVFTMMVGDTVRKRDHYIKNVAVNDVVFFRNKFPVEIDIEAQRFGKEDVTVSILKDGKTVASQTVKYTGSLVDFKHLSFLLDADRIGFQSYTVQLSDARNEYNYSNNRRSFYVEVVDSRSKVLLLAGAPHPDISAVKQELEKDENLEIKSFQFNNWDKDLKKVDLIVVHEPGFNMDSQTLRSLIDSKIPMLFFIGPNANAQMVQGLDLGIQVPPQKQTDETQGALNDGFVQFEVSQDLKRSLEYYPPLKTKFGELKIVGAEVLAFQRVGTVVKKEPLIFFVKRNNVKYGVIYGEGIWKWRLSEFSRTGEQKGFTELISKTGQYLLVKQNTSPLRVVLPKRFTKNEDIQVNASFYNESMEPITKPQIMFTLKDEKDKVSRFQFGVSGNMYRLSAGSLPPGKYEWSASTTYNGKKYARNGVFIVEDVNQEAYANSANPSVMKQLSNTTNGQFFVLSEQDKLLDVLAKRDDITTISYREASFDGLIDYKLLFLLLLLCISAEWFLRRYLGAY